MGYPGRSTIKSLSHLFCEKVDQVSILTIFFKKINEYHNKRSYTKAKQSLSHLLCEKVDQVNILAIFCLDLLCEKVHPVQSMQKK